MTGTTRIRMVTASAAAALTLSGALGIATGCRARDEGAAGQTRAAQGPAARKPASLDPRDQYDLATALTEVETGRAGSTETRPAHGDPDSAAVGYEKIRSSWTGKRYRWRVHVLAPLCRAPDACNVLPFELGGRDKGIVQGWMPRLVLDDRGFAAIQKICADRPMCQIDMEATLSQLIVDTENPTSLEFRDVRVF